MNDLFLTQDPLLADPAARADDGKTTVISFSHFVPRIECVPEKRYLLEPSLTKVTNRTRVCGGVG
jgi:hypothetical protein